MNRLTAICLVVLTIAVILSWWNAENLRAELYETQRLLCVKERERERWVYYAPCKGEDSAVLAERIKARLGH